MSSLEVLYLIVARAGSRGVPRKNLMRLNGISLVGYKAISARRAASCARLIISTDSHEIADEARSHAVEVPFLRPKELATDDAPTAHVLSHAMDWLEAQDSRYDAVMLLEPSSPFARASDYDAAVATMERTGATTVVGVRAVEVASAFVGPLDAEGRISSIVTKMRGLPSSRQALEREYTMNGCLYLVRWDAFRRSGRIYDDPLSTYAHVMESTYSVEIDTPMDLAFARFLVDQGYVDPAHWKDP